VRHEAPALLTAAMIPLPDGTTMARTPRYA
jgi:hypothetical protein